MGLRQNSSVRAGLSWVGVAGMTPHPAFPFSLLAGPAPGSGCTPRRCASLPATGFMHVGGLACPLEPRAQGTGLCTGTVRPHGASYSSGREGIDESKANALLNLFKGQRSMERAVPPGECATGARGQPGLSPPPATHGAPGKPDPILPGAEQPWMGPEGWGW